MKKDFIFVTLIIVLSLPLILPFFNSGFFPTHDGEWAVVRLGAMHRAAIDHHFPVRWAGNLNFGAGYPLFNFTYPLPYYLGEILNVIGFGLVGSIKFLFIGSVFLSGIGMFLLGRQFFGSLGGFLSSIFYLYVPYRLVNLYVRGSLGESLSFILYPMLFLVLYKIAQKESVRWVALFALLFSALLLTHNVSALLFSPFLVAFGLLLIGRESKTRKLLTIRIFGGLLLGALLALFFLVPAIFEKQNIILSQIKLTHLVDYFASLSQLILPSWGYGAYGQEDGLSIQLGFMHLIALLFVIWLLIQVKKRDKLHLITWFSIASLFVLTMLSLPISYVFWQNIPLFSDVDFPWRILGPAIFFLSLPIGALSTKRITSVLAIGFMIALMFVTLPYAKPKSYSDLPDSYYFTNEATTTSADELMPLWVKEKPKEREAERVVIAKGEGVLEKITFNSIKTNFAVDLKNEATIRVNTIYFPGWVASANNQEVQIKYDNPKGFMEITLPKGLYNVNIKFTETPLRIFSDIVSILAFFVVVFILLKGKAPLLQIVNNKYDK